MELLGGQEALVRILQQKNDPHLGEHPLPFSLVIKPWEMGMEFMLQCKHGALQYVVMKLLATILTYLCQSVGVYGEGEFSWTRAYPYLTFVMNFSVMYALYCLVKLFHAVNEELCHPIDWHPLGKFLCVKGVVFFTWWQGVIIYYLRAHGIIQGIGKWSSREVANGLIDYCICVEMIFFSIAHAYTFTYTEYLPSNIPEPSDGYQPPAIRTLSRPMGFRDAFWSSTVPNETLNDIQRLRNGVDNVMSQALSPGSISLRKVRSSDNVEEQERLQNEV
jgi:hypothetical protein